LRQQEAEENVQWRVVDVLILGVLLPDDYLALNSVIKLTKIFYFREINLRISVLGKLYFKT
jgi:hypothetical protein